VSDSHGGKTSRTHQHASDNHRPGAKAVSKSATKDPQTLLNKLTQTQSYANQQSSPAKLVNKMNRDKWENDKEAKDYQHIVEKKECFPQIPCLPDARHFPSRGMKDKKLIIADFSVFAQRAAKIFLLAAITLICE
jgi:hypothetical protein